MAEMRQLAVRDAVRLLAPGPLALVTSMYRDQPDVMTAGWLLPLSFEPTRVGVAIHPGRLTHEFISKTEVFALNIPTVDLLAAVHTCGLVSGREEDKFATTGLTPEQATAIDVPLVAQCVAHIECGVADRRSFGDHDLFVGTVLAASALDEAFDGVWLVDTEAGQLLHHLGGDRYAGLGRAYRVQSEPEQED